MSHPAGDAQDDQSAKWVKATRPAADRQEDLHDAEHEYGKRGLPAPVVGGDRREQHQQGDYLDHGPVGAVWVKRARFVGHSAVGAKHPRTGQKELNDDVEDEHGGQVAINDARHIH